MIEPYNAVGLIPSFWGIRRREDMAKNLEHIESLTHAAFWLSNLDIPVRLIAIPEGALQGFNDEVTDIDHAEYARTWPNISQKGEAPSDAKEWQGVPDKFEKHFSANPDKA